MLMPMLTTGTNANFKYKELMLMFDTQSDANMLDMELMLMPMLTTGTNANFKYKELMLIVDTKN